MEYPDVHWQRPEFVIGLTGGIGSGKSVVGKMFQDLGAQLLNADLVAHEVLYSPEMRDRLVESFGPEVLGPDGKPSRDGLARIVFRDETKRTLLNELIHPGVRKRFHAARAALGPGDVLVYDVPLLFEAGLEDDFDMVLVVSAPRDVRLERVKERNGWSEAEFQGRETAQIPLVEKEKRADLCIKNTVGLDELKNIVRDVYEHILRARKDGEN